MAKTGTNEEPIATSSIWSNMLPLKIKHISEVVVLKRFHGSRLVKFISELFSKIKWIETSIALDNGIFVNKLVTSNQIKNLPVTLTDLIYSINVKLSFEEYLGGIWGERREPKYWVRL